MSKKLACLLIVVVLVLLTLAFDSGKGGTVVSVMDATATAAAGEFHLQLTLVAQSPVGGQATPPLPSTPTP